MKTVLITSAIVASVIGVAVAGSLISAKNYGNEAQVAIDARYTDNQNIFAQFGQKVAEAVGVANLQAEQATALYATVLEARYGEGGLDAQVALIQEAMPGLDAGVYTQIQRIAEAGRNDFQFAQTQLTDSKAAYVTALGSFPRGMFLDMVGYPSINIGYPLGTQDDYPIITTTRAQETFESGVECGNALSAATGTDDC